MQLRRATADPQRLAIPHRRPLHASETRTARRAGRWATIIVATALVIAAHKFMANADVPRELRAIVPSTNCPARYAALLDLAELARRDGTSSEVVMRGLSGAGGSMNACPRMSISEETH
ncbi:hypothetical protein LMG27174_02314 [Paraburkholderia rhynchosiae]|nr:hypothetical protein LMG27174_02314 [Paraburkholderia rhynchosiae]